jgi:ferredoxin
MLIRRVWIEEGCISCNLCEDLAPEVFEVPAGSESKLRKRYERELASPEVQEKVREAEESCPVEVIKTDRAQEREAG